MPSKSTILGFSLVAAFLGSLFFAPKVLTKKNFSIELSKQIETTPTIPLDYLLERISIVNRKAKKAGKVSIRELLAETKGALLLNFWATWCPPCIEEIPSLELLTQKLSQSNLRKVKLVAVSVDESFRDIEKFIESFDFAPSFVMLYDPSGELAKAMGTSKFPETFLVDANAQVQFKWAGPQDWLSDDVMSQLATLFKP